MIRFSIRQIFGVLVVTLGVVITSLASMPTSVDQETKNVEAADFSIGILILALALVMSCLLGQFQQHVYSKFGKHWEEGLFYMHFLGLPGFLFVFSDIINSVEEYNQSRPISVGKSVINLIQLKDSDHLFGFDLMNQFYIPELWFYLILNTLTQFVCVSGNFNREPSYT